MVDETLSGFHVIGSATRYRDDDDTVREHIFLIKTGDTPVEEAEKKILEEHPAEHCQHSHDCCGRWYAGTPQVIKGATGTAFVSITSHKNV